MPNRWPILVRAALSAALTRLLDPAAGPGGVVLTGGGGTGKTTLARAAAQATGRPVRWVSATERAGAVPLGAFAELVPVEPPVEAAAVLRSAAAALTADEAMLVVDDAHLLDSVSATLVHQLAMSGVQLLVVLRDATGVPDALTALWKDEWLARVEVPPLTAAEIVEIAERALGGPVESWTADRLLELTEGNPQLLRHLVEGARAAGTLGAVGGVWQLRGEPPVDPRLLRLVEDRIAVLSPAQQRVLELLSLFEPIELDALTDLTSIAAVEAVERHDLLRVTADGARLSARLATPLYGAALAARLSPGSARALAGAVVRRVGDGAAGRTHRIRVAALSLAADAPPRPGLLVDAAADALRAGDSELAIRLARAAVEHGGGLPASTTLASASARHGRADEAVAELRRYDPDRLPDHQLPGWTLSLAANLYHSMSEPVDEPVRLLDRLRDRCADPAVTRLADALQSTFLLFSGRTAEAAELADRVLAGADPPPLALGWAATASTVAAALTGRFDAAARTARRGPAAALDPTGGQLRFTIGYGEILVLLLRGEQLAAERRARGYLAEAGADRIARSQAGVLLGRVLLVAGDLPGALAVLREASAGLEGTHSPLGVVGAADLACTYAMLGRVAEARAALARAQARHAGRLALFDSELLLGQAWLAAADSAAQGPPLRRAALGLARRFARTAAARADERGQFAVAGYALLVAARLGDRTVADPLAELTVAAACPAIGTAAAMARALADDDGRGLVEAAARFERAGMRAAAADTFGIAVRALARRRRYAEQLTAAASAERLAVACGELRTPAVLAAAMLPLPLSERERQVACLVADGLNNREIADRLVVSVRTVEGHVYRACAKLQMAGRVELATLIGAGRIGPCDENDRVPSSELRMSQTISEATVDV